MSSKAPPLHSPTPALASTCTTTALTPLSIRVESTRYSSLPNECYSTCTPHLTSLLKFTLKNRPTHPFKVGCLTPLKELVFRPISTAREQAIHPPVGTASLTPQRVCVSAGATTSELGVLFSTSGTTSLSLHNCESTLPTHSQMHTADSESRSPKSLSQRKASD